MSQVPQQHRARKRFGQNFLRDLGIISRIVRAIGPREGDRLVEIGPGQGALTAPLLEAAGKLEGIELDRDLIPGLRVQFFNYPEFVIHEGDALKFDFAELKGDGPALRVVGNLPYNISSPLLFALLASAAPITDMHFMLQKEVVDRMVAREGEADYGRLSVAIAARATATALFDVGPGAFTPPPKVTSAVVRLVPRTPDFTVDDQQVFDRVIAAAFNQRRKTLRNALKNLLSADEIAACEIDPGLRAERVSPAAFARLANTAARHH